MEHDTLVFDGSSPAELVDPPAPQPILTDRAGDDPHGFYRKWRAISPLVEFRGDDAPVDLLQATRHDDVQQLVSDPRTRQFETELLGFRGISSGPLFDFYDNVMLASNPPVHQKRRAPLSRTFAFKLMDAWRPHIRALAHQLIDEATHNDEIDFTTNVAAQLPPRIVASVMGLDQVDVDHFLALVRICSRGLSNFPDEEFERIDAAMGELVEYVKTQIADRRKAPRDDVLSAYARDVDAGGELSEAEQLAQIAAVILAGSDTTRTGITAMMSELLTRPEQWRKIKAAPEQLAANTALEALRFEPPVATIPRITLEDIAVGDRVAPAGRVLSLSVLSALRDPNTIRDPDEFYVDREDIPRWLLTFGGGAHRCLGEALARAEMEEMLIVAADRMATAELIDKKPRVIGAIGIRDVGELRVRLK